MHILSRSFQFIGAAITRVNMSHYLICQPPTTPRVLTLIPTTALFWSCANSQRPKPGTMIYMTPPSNTITHPIPNPITTHNTWHHPFCHFQILLQTQPFTNWNIKHHIPHKQDGDYSYMEGTQTELTSTSAYLKRKSCYSFQLKEQESKILM